MLFGYRGPLMCAYRRTGLRRKNRTRFKVNRFPNTPKNIPRLKITIAVDGITIRCRTYPSSAIRSIEASFLIILAINEAS
jgi:hypothetical protein